MLTPHGLLWVYDRHLGSYKQLPPTVICFEKDVYAFKPQDGRPRDRRVETKGLSLVDGMGATAIRELLAGKADLETICGVAYFVGVQFSRIPSIGQFLGEVYVHGAKEAMRLMAISNERMQGVLENYTGTTGKSMGVSAASMVAAVRNNGLQISSNEVPFLNHLFSLAADVSTVIGRLQWQLLISPPQNGFIICDAPVTVVPPMGSRELPESAEKPTEEMSQRRNHGESILSEPLG